jgi:hypothetical protein
VIHANSVGEQVTRKYVADFIFNTFQIKMDHTTVGDKLKEWGFTFRKHGTVNASRKKSNAEMVGIAYDFLKDIKIKEYIDPAFYNIDFTYNSHRNFDTRGFALEGVPAQKIKHQVGEYTNCFVTCYHSSGVTLPTVMFTSNKAFHWDDSKHAKRREARAHFRELALRYNINRSHVVYLDDVGGKFVKETYQIVQMYFALVKLDNACAVFTDGGLAFHHDRKSVVTEAGYTHVPLPACVHQYLSVNDNNAHGYAKAKWRKKVHDHSDDVNSSLALMHELNSIPKDVIEKWFNRNYLLHSNNMQVVHVEDLIVAPSKNNRRHHEIALHQFLQKYGRDYGYGDDIAEEILSELDGAYWAL